MCKPNAAFFDGVAAGAHDSAGSESVRGVMAIVIGVVPRRTDFCGVDFGVDLCDERCDRGVTTAGDDSGSGSGSGSGSKQTPTPRSWPAPALIAAEGSMCKSAARSKKSDETRRGSTRE